MSFSNVQPAIRWKQCSNVWENWQWSKDIIEPFNHRTPRLPLASVSMIMMYKISICFYFVIEKLLWPLHTCTLNMSYLSTYLYLYNALYMGCAVVYVMKLKNKEKTLISTQLTLLTLLCIYQANTTHLILDTMRTESIAAY